MSNQEMTIKIGEYIVDLELKNAAIMSFLRETRSQNGHFIDWGSKILETVESPALSQIAHERIGQLNTLISPSSSDEEYIQRLFQAVIPAPQ